MILSAYKLNACPADKKLELFCPCDRRLMLLQAGAHIREIDAADTHKRADWRIVYGIGLAGFVFTVFI
jgi:hypothetical protein